MNQALTIQFSVISDITTGNISWQEIHQDTTNAYGLFTAIIGQGTSTNSGSSAAFDSIDWGASLHYLKVEIDYGNGFSDMGTTAFMSVPYSMNASNVNPTDELQSLSISGDTLFISSGNSIVIPGLSLINSLIIQGCTDLSASNYNASANTDDGSCIPCIYGCMDSTALNYNSVATCDDGICILPIYGCMDSTMWNYNPLANVDNGSCEPFIYGCNDTSAFNYNSSTNTSDGSCCYVAGCTDPSSIYFDSLACYNDGSCTPQGAPCDDGDDCTYGDVWNNGVCVGTTYSCDDGDTCTIDVCDGAGGCVYTSTNLNGCPLQIGQTYQGGIIFYLDGNGGGLIAAPSDQGMVEWGCSGTLISGADGTAIGTGYQNTIDILAGCTTSGIAADICANLTLNGYSDWFLPSAYELEYMYLNISQGSALGNIGGFVDDSYWSSTEVTDSKSITYDFFFLGIWFTTPKENSGYVRAVRAFGTFGNGCTDSTAFNYDPLAFTDDGSCIIYGCTDSTALNYNPLANTDDGSCIAVVNGCTDSTAANYNPLANTDDGTCIAAVSGCTDSTAFNYNPLANTDDGSCASDSCAYYLGLDEVIIILYDSYLDGWNGNSLTVDGVNYTMTGGAIDTITVCVDLDSCIYVAYNHTGGWPYENSWVIYSGGVVVLSGNNASASVPYDQDDGTFGTCMGCTDSTAINYNASANTDDGSCIGIGDAYQGGIIFYILQYGDIGYVAGQVHGLIAAPSDQGYTEWGCSGTNIPGAEGSAIGTGVQNTIDIEAGCTTPGIAADICANYTDGTYSDWFLPSKDELNKMYLNIGQGNALGLGNIGGFGISFYWSSTEYDSFSAWGQWLDDGTQNYSDKNFNFVRAVRAF